MPPIELPWPPRNLVSECTTMSAPCSIGLHRYGVGRAFLMVLKTAARGALCAHAPPSVMTPRGLAIDSVKIALVFGLIARSKEEISSGSAQTTFQLKFLNAWLN